MRDILPISRARLARTQSLLLIGRGDEKQGESRKLLAKFQPRVEKDTFSKDTLSWEPTKRDKIKFNYTGFYIPGKAIFRPFSETEQKRILALQKRRLGLYAETQRRFPGQQILIPAEIKHQLMMESCLDIAQSYLASKDFLNKISGSEDFRTGTLRMVHAIITPSSNRDVYQLAPDQKQKREMRIWQWAINSIEKYKTLKGEPTFNS